MFREAAEEMGMPVSSGGACSLALWSGGSVEEEIASELRQGIMGMSAWVNGG